MLAVFPAKKVRQSSTATRAHPTHSAPTFVPFTCYSCCGWWRASPRRWFPLLARDWAGCATSGRRRAARRRGEARVGAGGRKGPPGDLRGVRAMWKAPKRGEGMGRLPDQGPGSGEGEWLGFFGRPAYAMTLVGRIAEQTGAPVLL